ncbi:MAG: hypothetical protein HOQ03_14155 [Thermoleophilia bacterium]|nr:hypothetical protein [Thermoleophilia bacterium]
MRELLLYPSRGRMRFAYWAAGAMALLLLLDLTGAVELSERGRWKLLLFSPLALLAVVGVKRHNDDPHPRLRLSPDGLEGTFGLIRWEDVAGVETAVDWSLHSRGRDVVVRLRPGAAVLDPTREFTSGPLLYDDAGIDGAKLTIMRGSLGLSPQELAEEIRAYRRKFSAGSETALREGRRR